MKKALIIGAGPAGLTAAYELLSQSKENISESEGNNNDLNNKIKRKIKKR